MSGILDQTSALGHPVPELASVSIRAREVDELLGPVEEQTQPVTVTGTTDSESQLPQQPSELSHWRNQGAGVVSATRIANITTSQFVLRSVVFISILVLLEYVIKVLVTIGNITFPTSVIGLVICYMVFSYIKHKYPRFLHDQFLPWLYPGSTVLSRGMSLFFFVLLVPIPILVSPSLIEVIKLMVLLIVGGLATILIGAYAALFFRQVVPGWRHPEHNPVHTHRPAPASAASCNGSHGGAAAPPPARTLEQEQWHARCRVMAGITVTSLLGAIISYRLSDPEAVVDGEGENLGDSGGHPLHGFAYTMSLIFHLFTSLTAFLSITFLVAPKIKSVIPPALMFVAVVICAIFIQSLCTGLPLRYLLSTYITNTPLPPVPYTSITEDVPKPIPPGGGDFIKLLLGPSVMNIAVKMLQDSDRIQHCKYKIMLSVLVDMVISLILSAVGARALFLGEMSAMAAIPRFVTAPIAIELAQQLGASPAYTAAICIVSGTIGSALGIPLLNALKVDNKVARGVGVGSGAHGLGTAALIGGGEQEAGAVAGVSFALMGIFVSITFAIPGVTEVIRMIVFG